MGTTVDGSEIRLTTERMVLKPYEYWDIYYKYLNWCSISSQLCPSSMEVRKMWRCHYGFPPKRRWIRISSHKSEIISRYNKSLLHLEVEIVGVQTTVSPTLYCIVSILMINTNMTVILSKFEARL